MLRPVGRLDRHGGDRDLRRGDAPRRSLEPVHVQWCDPPTRGLPARPRPVRGRRGAHPSAARRPGPEPGRPGRDQPRLGARGDGPWLGPGRLAGQLPRRTPSARRPGTAPHVGPADFVRSTAERGPGRVAGHLRRPDAAPRHQPVSRRHDVRPGRRGPRARPGAGHRRRADTIGPAAALGPGAARQPLRPAHALGRSCGRGARAWGGPAADPAGRSALLVRRVVARGRAAQVFGTETTRSPGAVPV